MGIFDMMKKRSLDSDTDTPDTIDTFSGNGIRSIQSISINSHERKNDDMRSRPLPEDHYFSPELEKPTSQDALLSPEPSSADLLSRIKSILANGPVLYDEVIAQTGASEDEAREAIRTEYDLISGRIPGMGDEFYWWIVNTASHDAPSCPVQAVGQITSHEEPTNEPETALADFDSLTERIGIRFDGPEVSGEPVLFHKEDGRPLAYASDPPHIRLFAWALMNVSHVIPGLLDAAQIAKDCQLTVYEVKGALDRLMEDGDLIRTVERKRELFRLQIKY